MASRWLPGGFLRLNDGFLDFFFLSWVGVGGHAGYRFCGLQNPLYSYRYTVKCYFIFTEIHVIFSTIFPLNLVLSLLIPSNSCTFQTVPRHIQQHLLATIAMTSYMGLIYSLASCPKSGVDVCKLSNRRNKKYYCGVIRYDGREPHRWLLASGCREKRTPVRLSVCQHLTVVRPARRHLLRPGPHVLVFWVVRKAHAYTRKISGSNCLQCFP